MYAAAIVVKVVTIWCMVLSTLCIVNGGRWLMVLPLAVSIGVLVLSDELLDATEKRMK